MSPHVHPRLAADAIDRDFSWTVYRAVGGAMRLVTRAWFRYRIQGLDRVPSTPALLVGNHSGIGVADVICLLGGWYDHFGTRRRASGLMHDLFVDAPLLGRLCRGFGAVRATPENARLAAKAGHDIFVFPGGDIDACRPLTRAREVDFGNRRGYVRLALETKRPIVPVVTLGSHATFLLLPLDALWRAVGLRKLTRMERLPVPVAVLPVAAILAAVAFGAISAAWLVPALLVLLVPNPVRVSSRVLAPIDVAAATAHIEDFGERVEEAHKLVHGALAAELRKMQHDEIADPRAHVQRTGQR
jgi:1-acyl-sn-glycerol-3-phosphate acyltransferase